MTTIRALCLLLAPASLLAGCSQGPTASQAELQDRLVAAEARASAAEKRAKNVEAVAQLHAQEPAQHAQAAAADTAESPNDFGQPVNDTAPIEPVPAVNPDPPQQ